MTVDDWNGMGPLDEKDADERARRAIEASTLGTEAARAVRAQVRPEVSDALLQRVRARLAAEGLPGGAVHPAGDDPGQDQSAVTGGPAAAAEPVTGAAEQDSPLGWRHDDEHIDQLMSQYFPPGHDAETLTCADDPRRARVLALLADRIEEVTGRAAEDIAESSRFREDLAVDSLDAVEIAAAMEDEFPTRVSAGQLASLHTVSDAIDLLLGHIPATQAAEFDPMSPTTSTASSSRRKKQAL
ncbi:acyl carrier protein [Mycolicibacterium mageritense]|uniref:acyl carrier protein n=1 Tax=Mycolicibacterium mageritense TaxID=53462 RepID=UPI001E5ED2BE|nr:acyl carrier protein [Mycolicibacterium mageritense]MCC9186625.1 acyl carrier protein [Mycolicibacterium mageritense]